MSACTCSPSSRSDSPASCSAPRSCSHRCVWGRGGQVGCNSGPAFLFCATVMMFTQGCVRGRWAVSQRGGEEKQICHLFIFVAPGAGHLLQLFVFLPHTHACMPHLTCPSPPSSGHLLQPPLPRTTHAYLPSSPAPSTPHPPTNPRAHFLSGHLLQRLLPSLPSPPFTPPTPTSSGHLLQLLLSRLHDLPQVLPRRCGLPGGGGGVHLHTPD